MLHVFEPCEINVRMSMPSKYVLPAKLDLTWSLVSRPLRATFGISRGSKNYALSLRVELTGAGAHGVGESVPYARYGEHLEFVRLQLGAIQRELESGRSLNDILEVLDGGCIREAIDAARWDYLCKSRKTRIRELLEIDTPPLIRTYYTVSLDTPENMAQQAKELATFSSLKLKLGGDAMDIERIQAVAHARPDARLVADANEGWNPQVWPSMGLRAKKAGLCLIEQPFAAQFDALLAAGERPLPVFADESVHGLDSLLPLVGRYDGVNVKLGKCGGLDRGIEMIRRARALGFKVMLGCMVGSSRSIAPALVLAALADEVDLDAHLWLVHDLQPSLKMEGDQIRTDFPAALWG